MRQPVQSANALSPSANPASQAASRSRGGVFLLEFIIVLLIFSLASIVTVRLFAKTALLRDEVVQTDRAVSAALSLTGLLKASDGGDNALDALFGPAQADGIRSLSLDAEGRACDESAAQLAARTALSVSDTAGGRLVEGTLEICDCGAADGEPLFSLPFAVFFPAESDEVLAAGETAGGAGALQTETAKTAQPSEEVGAA